MAFMVETVSTSSWWETAGAGALIGVGGAVLGSIVGPILERRFSRRKLLEEAHLRAAEKHGTTVAQIYRSIDRVAYEVLGDEAGVVDPEGSASVDPMAEAGSAIAMLRELRAAHPTKEVREAALALEKDLRSFYGNPPVWETERWPSFQHRDDLLRHGQKAAELIEALHVPPKHGLLINTVRKVRTPRVTRRAMEQ